MGIVGSLGLASNLAGFFVLGGHSHGETEHDDPVDDVRTVEEGYGGHTGAIEAEYSFTPSQIRVVSSSNTGANSNIHRRRRSKLGGIVDGSMYPASFREGIIRASKSTSSGPGTATVLDESEDDTATRIADPVKDLGRRLRIATTTTASPRRKQTAVLIWAPVRCSRQCGCDCIGAHYLAYSMVWPVLRRSCCLPIHCCHHLEDDHTLDYRQRQDTVTRYPGSS